jgi:hypothetical protein
MKQIPIFVIASLITHGALASEQRQAGAHVHGLNTLRLAMEGQTLEISYQMPIVQLIGNDSMHHEHEHDEHEHDEHEHDEHGHDEHGHDEHGHDDQEKEAPQIVEQRLNAFESFGLLFELPAKANCRLTDFESQLRAVHSESDHDHNHDHDDTTGHQDVLVEYRFTCSAPEAFNGLVLNAFETYDDLDTIAVEAVTERGVTAQRMTKDDPRISL